MTIILSVLCVLLLAVTGLLLLMLRRLDRSSLGDLFKSVSMDALGQQARIGAGELEAKKKEVSLELTSKKELIDQRLEAIRGELDKVEKSLLDSQKQNEGMTARLDSASREIKGLTEITGRLNEMLGASQKRGEWGERMAEDILGLAGLKDGINFVQQKSTESGKPDFTFLLPNGLKVHMDCKFPLAGYKKFVEAASEADKESAKKQVLSDARSRLKEVAKRDYIDPASGTLDYAVVFFANEQVFNFVNEHDPDFMDEALKLKILVCSPFTLYAFVSVIRQAAENFRMEQDSREILAQLAKFRRQWSDYVAKFDGLGSAIEKVRVEYETLTTTRARLLEVPLREVERLSGKIDPEEYSK
jgi:DNA recombination protein RmuC